MKQFGEADILESLSSRRATSRSSLGKLGEDVAREYLERQGYKVIGQNVRLGRHDEIDLIANQDKTTVFVEVKTRSSDRFGAPEESITARKRRSIERAIYTYIKQHPEVKNVRLDVVSILIKSDGLGRNLKHFRAVGGSLVFF